VDARPNRGTQESGRIGVECPVPGPPRVGMLGRVALRGGVFFLIQAAILFLPAGFGWRNGQVFCLVFLGLMIFAAVHLWRRNPDIFVARSRIHKGTKSWDKGLLALLLASFFSVFAVAAFDARYGWSSVPVWLIVLGYVLLSLGHLMSIRAYVVNKFAEPSVRIQSERGQKVVDAGPYAIVRHPLYLGSLLFVGGIPLALGSFRALLPAGVWAVTTVVRTALEDRVLRSELEGYKDYASRVRYRLIPGLW